MKSGLAFNAIEIRIIIFDRRDTVVLVIGNRNDTRARGSMLTATIKTSVYSPLFATETTNKKTGKLN